MDRFSGLPANTEKSSVRISSKRRIGMHVHEVSPPTFRELNMAENESFGIKDRNLLIIRRLLQSWKNGISYKALRNRVQILLICV